MESKYNISSDVIPYLDEIADKLWSQPSHATIMVGAGFSKNASASFPDWNALGDVFYKKLYSKEPEQENIRYVNVLKLADGVEAAFGRATLNKILKTEIPNTSVEPSKLHRDLLLLPWADVFTTNYDTLLERASNLVSSRRYDVVVNTEELVYSNSPRIIKLHGSFPSKTPFIITEEDYRKYPHNYAPFVNTVQQSLLENTLCLVGFSGDDPNFLNWIGWIRDNLGQKNAPKIYLIGLFDFTDAELKLLDARNIITVNMGHCEITDHRSAMDAFFSYLKAKDNKFRTLNWPGKIGGSSPDRLNNDKTIEIQIKEETAILINLRNNYPGWVVAPYSARRKIWQHISSWLNFLSPKDKVSLNIKAFFIKELIWHIDICLCPIFDNLAILITYLVSECEKLESIGNSEFKQDELPNIIFTLKLALIRYYREEYRWSDWDCLIKQLQEKNISLSPQKEQLNYEVCLGYFFRLDFKSLNRELNLWSPSKHWPLWLLRKAGLVAEFGDVEKAKNLSQEALLTIREKLNLSVIKEDLSLLSQESYAMMTLHLITTADNIYTDMVNDDFNERWQELSIYKCDPWKEFEYLDFPLKYEYQDPRNKAKLPNYDIGSYQTTHYMGDDIDAIKGYNLLRLYEVTGLPVKLYNTNLFGSSLSKAIEAVVGHSPLWATFFAIRLADNKKLNKPFGRKSIFKISRKTITQAASIYIECMKGLNKGFSNNKRSQQQNLNDRLATILPEALSRLVSRLHFTEIKTIYSHTCQLFGSNLFSKYEGLENILKRIPNVVSKEEASQLIKFALSCRCPENLHPIDEKKSTPPVYHFDLTSLKKITINSNDFDYLLSLVDDKNQLKQKWGMLTLVKFYEGKVLSKKQSQLFGRSLWKKTGINGLPKNDILLGSAFIYLPSPKDKNEIILLTKEWILSLEIPIRGDNKSYRCTNGDIAFYNELLNSHKELDLTLIELKTILDKLINCWKKDSHYLLEDKNTGLFGSTSDEFEARFIHLINVLCDVILPKLSKNDLNKTQQYKIKTLLSELENSKLATLKLKISSRGIVEANEKETSEALISAFVSGNEKHVVDACDTLNYWLSIHPSEHTDRCIKSLTTKILMRSNGGLSYSIQTLALFIKKYQTHISNDVISTFCKALIILKSDTELLTEDTELIIADKLFLRKVASQAAFDLYNSDIKSKNDDISSLLIWKDIILSDYEFNEIKNIWIT